MLTLWRYSSFPSLSLSLSLLLCFSLRLFSHRLLLYFRIMQSLSPLLSPLVRSLCLSSPSFSCFLFRRHQAKTHTNSTLFQLFTACVVI